MSNATKGMSAIAKQAMLMPKESLMTAKNRKQEFNIGIPKETLFQENRIALTPLSVGLLVNNGHEVRLETGAGNGAKFSDTAYSENGGQITYDRQKVWESDIIIKVGPPTLEEIGMMKIGQTLISGLQVATLKPEYLKALMAKKNNCDCLRIFKRRREYFNSSKVYVRNCWINFDSYCFGIIKYA